MMCTVSEAVCPFARAAGTEKRYVPSFFVSVPNPILSRKTCAPSTGAPAALVTFPVSNASPCACATTGTARASIASIDRTRDIMRPPVVGSCGKSWSHYGSNDEASPRTSAQKGWTAITSLTSARHGVGLPAHGILENQENQQGETKRAATQREKRLQLDVRCRRDENRAANRDCQEAVTMRLLHRDALHRGMSPAN